MHTDLETLQEISCRVAGTIDYKNEAHTVHFLDIYEKHFQYLRDKPLKFLEIGVAYGGSVRMWKEYFPRAEIYGIDISPECRQYAEDRIHIHIGSQNDAEFIKNFLSTVGGNFDIIIDDGGHMMNQQMTSLKLLFNQVKPGGHYVIEDLVTSYWGRFGGSYKGNTTVELLKGLVDNLNAIHMTRQDCWNDTEYLAMKTTESYGFAEPVENVNKKIKSVHFYDSLCIMDLK
jgi:ubiquinone/menaquinone biosynthesis C-methylase UbiE